MAPARVSSINVGHIEDVQELTRAKPHAVPERFIREGSERPSMVATRFAPGDDNDGGIPIVDLSKLAGASGDGFHGEILKLKTACEEWGFFQVINHGMDLELVEGIERVATEFFMMPLEEKQKYPMAPGTIQGYGQAFVFSEDQKLDWCNMFALGIHPHYIRNPLLWPAKPAAFSETLEDYSRHVRKLCEKILKHIAISLGLRGSAFEEMFGEAVQAVRMNYYPPCPRPDLVLGLSPHTDGSALTVLQQGKGNPVGLQILKDNIWVPVQPLPDALIINIGDTIEVLTNGKYRSAEHRVVTDKDRERLSIVTFYAPSYDMEVGPMAQLVNENSPCKYRRYNHGEYSRHYTSNKLQGKRTLDFARIQK